MDRVSKAERELVRKIQKQTNADRIRAMTDEELCSFLYWDADGCGKAKQEWLDWLKQEDDNGRDD